MTDYTREEVVEKEILDRQAIRAAAKNELEKEFTQKELEREMESIELEIAHKDTEPCTLKSAEQIARE